MDTAVRPAANDHLIDQLVRTFQHLGARRISDEIDRAIRDLQRSVSLEDLPEMVIRLASHRLGAVDDLALAR